MKTLVFITLSGYLLLTACNIFNPKRNGLYYDPIEDDPEYTAVFEEVAVKVKQSKECNGLENELGGVHCFWDVKKRILKEEYGIIWKSPADLNPGVIIE